MDGREFDPLQERFHAVPEKIESRLIFGSDDLRTVLMTELEEMAAQNILVKNVPLAAAILSPSSKTVYCDRTVGETRKNLQELAAKEKYEKDRPLTKAYPSISGAIKPMLCGFRVHQQSTKTQNIKHGKRKLRLLFSVISTGIYLWRLLSLYLNSRNADE